MKTLSDANLKLESTKTFIRKVELSDIAAFDVETVHQVYATFAIGRDAEWVCRLFVHDLREEDEEGIGTALNVEHHAPAKLGETVTFTARINQFEGNHLICSFEARTANRLVASGNTSQKILKKNKLEAIFQKL